MLKWMRVGLATSVGARVGVARQASRSPAGRSRRRPGAVRVATGFCLLSWAAVVALIVIGVIGLDNRSDRWPPIGWITTASCVSALVAGVVAIRSLRTRESDRSTIDVSRRVLVGSTVSFFAAGASYYLLVAFVYSRD